MRWHPASDFSFSIQSRIAIEHTKRQVLVKTARLFDPMGWLAPVIIRAKILIHSAWLKGLGYSSSCKGHSAMAATSLRVSLIRTTPYKTLAGYRQPRLASRVPRLCRRIRTRICSRGLSPHSIGYLSPPARGKKQGRPCEARVASTTRTLRRRLTSQTHATSPLFPEFIRSISISLDRFPGHFLLDQGSRFPMENLCSQSNVADPTTASRGIMETLDKKIPPIAPPRESRRRTFWIIPSDEQGPVG